MTPPLLVFGWGNESRGDDALGPLFVDRLRTLSGAAGKQGVEFLDDYQLQIEHALDLVGRERVLFVDAASTGGAPYEVAELRPFRDASFTSHSISPQSVMRVYRDLYGADPPPCRLLAIRGTRFELGEPLSSEAVTNLEAALAFGRRWLTQAHQSIVAGRESDSRPAGAGASR